MASKFGRISESDLLIPTLRVLKAQAGDFVKTSDLIVELEGIIKPIGEDAEILEGRHDTRFSQIVRNMVSHKGSPNNIVTKGFAIYSDEYHGLKITDLGIKYLENKGY